LQVALQLKQNLAGAIALSSTWFIGVHGQTKRLHAIIAGKFCFKRVGWIAPVENQIRIE
jgi:hypothetical protein